MTASHLPPHAQMLRTGLGEAVLREIAGHLERLACDPGFEEIIDLRSLPMTNRDRTELMEGLGQGEVEAVLDIAGETRVSECGYAGVWHVVHLGAAGDVASEQIVVALVPEILKSHPDDIAAAAARLGGEIAMQDGGTVQDDTATGSDHLQGERS